MTLLADGDLFARLVAFDSVSRNSNRPIADFIADYLDRPGVRIRENPSPDGSKVNLVIATGPDVDDRSGLGLSGHMDVVPADEDGWTSDPFTLTDAGTRWVGRGSADMKGFLALAMNRLAALTPDALARPLTLIFTRDEELGTIGAQHFAATWTEVDLLPADVVIGEPTSLAVIGAHKGYLKARLTFTGVAAHSGYPHLGRSAIEPAGRAVVALEALRRELEAERPRHHERFGDVPFPALNLGTVRGGSAINVVPDHCALELGVRLLPDMDADAMIERIRGAVARGAGPSDWSIETLGASPPMLLPDNAPLHRDLLERMAQAGTRAVSFATDGGWLQTMGCACVVWGPGAIEVAHKPDEYMPKAEFRRAGEVLDRLVHDRCVRAA